MTNPIEFSKEEITFAVSMAEYAKTRLQEQHENSHSGVDQLLINGWIMSTEELADKFKSHLESLQSESESEDEDLPVRPEQ
jgi:hypothetical protein